MQKRINALTLAVFLAFSMAVSAAAATPRWNSTGKCTPTLSFSGTTATCKLAVEGTKGATISGTLTLYKVVNGATTQLTSWSVSGTTSLTTSKTYTVTKGQEYQLTANITVDGSGGKDSISQSVKGTCG